MIITEEEKGILRGDKGETLKKVLETVVQYGEIFGATHLEPLDKGVHLVTSFGLSLLTPLFDMIDDLIQAELHCEKPFTMDPGPSGLVDLNLSPFQRLLFKIMYKKQTAYESQLKKVGLKGSDGYSCACYLDEVGARPEQGDILCWAESSAIIFANSVVGARTNRTSAVIELLCGILGKTPCFGLLTDEGRLADWAIQVEGTQLPEPQLLGSAIGMKVGGGVPYIYGLSELLSEWEQQEREDYLKNAGAAMASNGSVGLYHIDGITPEALEKGSLLLKESHKTYVINKKELNRVRSSYPVIWKNPESSPQRAFIGCPHLSFRELKTWIGKLEKELSRQGRKKLSCLTTFTTAPGVIKKARKEGLLEGINRINGELSDICPLMFMANPLLENKPVITNSNKLRTYTTARYYTDDQLLELLTSPLEKQPALSPPAESRNIPRRTSPSSKKNFKGRLISGKSWSGEAVVSRTGFNTLASMKKSLLAGKKKITVSDQDNRDLYGKVITGKALCIPETIGSTTGGLVFQTAINKGAAPAALLFSRRVDSLAAGGIICSAIWNKNNREITVVDELGEEFLSCMETGSLVRIQEDGTVIIE